MYDARPLSRNEKFKGEQNKIAKFIKIIGFCFMIIGAILIYTFFKF